MDWQMHTNFNYFPRKRQDQDYETCHKDANYKKKIKEYHDWRYHANEHNNLRKGDAVVVKEKTKEKFRPHMRHVYSIADYKSEWIANQSHMHKMRKKDIQWCIQIQTIKHNDQISNTREGSDSVRETSISLQCSFTTAAKPWATTSPTQSRATITRANLYNQHLDDPKHNEHQPGRENTTILHV